MSNPVLSAEAWKGPATYGAVVNPNTTMTVQGTVQKTGFLVALLMAVFAVSWMQLSTTQMVFGLSPMIAMIIGAVVGLLAVVITMFTTAAALPCAIVYALAEGLVLGVLSHMLEARFPGIALAAGGLTILTLAGMLMMYLNGWIRATPTFIKVIVGATVGLMLGLGLLALLSLFGIGGEIRHALYGAGPIGIGFSLICVGLAALNLVLDFHVIEEGAANRLNKRMEWMAALGLLVTLVWLYIEIIRLLAKLREE